jgi:PHD/YefM family antitoxin component YafN of YafNO toxin-antitoxin module
MKTIKLSEASRPLAEYARQLDEDIVLIADRNQPVAAVLSLTHVDQEVLSLSRSPQFLKIIRQSRRDFRAGRSRSLAEVRELFGLGKSANPETKQFNRHDATDATIHKARNTGIHSDATAPWGGVADRPLTSASGGLDGPRWRLGGKMVFSVQG